LELNFSEAMTHVYKCFIDPCKLRDSVQEVIDDPKISSTQEKSKYWLMAAALARFFTEFKALPLSGKLPDMTATTEFYISLQNM
jgi:amyloid beta precursor protein binding protein 1